jgi:4-hydroxy-4-methyl-2-oxoglutarate aldolase
MKRMTSTHALPVLLALAAALAPGVARAQVGVLDREGRIAYSPKWTGERFPDGRPKVPDDLIERLKRVSLEEAWGVCRDHGYNNQFEGNWVMTESEPLLVGRAVTSYFLPLRPDVNEAVQAWGKKTGQKGGENSWVIDTLVKGDVLVVDLMGKVIDATFMGDNLGNSIWAKTGTGVIIDGGARDLEGVQEIGKFPVFNRGWDPSFLQGTMIMGINTPIRIGRAIVMPGDAVLGKREGVFFVPAHLVQEVVETSEVIRLRDDFGHQRLREGKYTPGEIDTKWTDAIEKDFLAWVKERRDELTDFQRRKFLGEGK